MQVADDRYRLAAELRIVAETRELLATIPMNTAPIDRIARCRVWDVVVGPGGCWRPELNRRGRQGRSDVIVGLDLIASADTAPRP